MTAGYDLAAVGITLQQADGVGQRGRTDIVE